MTEPLTTFDIIVISIPAVIFIVGIIIGFISEMWGDW